MLFLVGFFLSLRCFLPFIVFHSIDLLPGCFHLLRDVFRSNSMSPCVRRSWHLRCFFSPPSFPFFYAHLADLSHIIIWRWASKANNQIRADSHSLSAMDRLPCNRYAFLIKTANHRFWEMFHHSPDDSITKRMMNNLIQFDYFNSVIWIVRWALAVCLAGWESQDQYISI